jgi:putative tricarboxylic transport membrane protein
MIRPDRPDGGRPDRAAFAIALGLALFGAVLIWDAARLPVAAGYAGVGPAEMPRLVGGMLILLAGFTVVSGLRRGPPSRPRQDLGPVLWITGGVVAQIVLLQVAGFSIASGVLFACTAAAFGYRNFAVSLPAGIVLAFAVYGVFDRLLSLNLPAGLPETLVYGG